MASVRSWGNTSRQVKKFNKEGKGIINDYVEITFKDSPNKVKIKNELNKKFDKGKTLKAMKKILKRNADQGFN